MLQQDYLMRMFTALAIAMRESMLRAQGDEDPEGAAELLEAALDKTTEIDGALLLSAPPCELDKHRPLRVPMASNWVQPISPLKNSIDSLKSRMSIRLTHRIPRRLPRARVFIRAVSIVGK